MAKELMLVSKAKYMLKCENNPEKYHVTKPDNSDLEMSGEEDTSGDIQSTLEYVVPKDRLRKAWGL